MLCWRFGRGVKGTLSPRSMRHSYMLASAEATMLQRASGEANVIKRSLGRGDSVSEATRAGRRRFRVDSGESILLELRIKLGTATSAAIFAGYGISFHVTQKSQRLRPHASNMLLSTRPEI